MMNEKIGTTLCLYMTVEPTTLADLSWKQLKFAWLCQIKKAPFFSHYTAFSCQV